MTKMTQAQHLVLSSAFDHERGLATRPANLKPAQALRMAAFFADNQLAKEVKAKGDDPVWREDDQERSLALKILKAGRSVFETEQITPPDSVDDGSASRREAQPPDGSVSTAPIGGPKTMLVLSLMQRPSGATIEDLMLATSWLPHTTRAALSGLRKKGVVIERRAAEQGRGSVYRVADGTSREAA